MLNELLIVAGIASSSIIRKLNLGNGSTWPGHIALKVNKNFVKQTLEKSKTKTIIVAGTNGKTTTSALIAHILKENGKSVLQNESGANLLNGIASAIILNSDMYGKLNKNYAIFEVDENALPLVLKEFTPDYLVLLNLFRDQLDRYGEVRTIIAKWKKAFESISNKTKFIMNADDPEIAYSKVDNDTAFFGLNEKTNQKQILEHAVDSIYCPKCGNKLEYKNVYYSHLGDWYCPSCELRRPQHSIDHAPSYPLPGTYNKYNVLAATALAETNGINDEDITKSFRSFKPAFGRQEEVIIDGKKVKIFLSKNPTGFNESLRTVKELGAKNILFVLNDRIPDGRDVSWIWDTDIEGILDFNENISVSGDRTYDMALRIKYAIENQNSKIKIQNHNSKFKTFENLDQAIKENLQNLSDNETLYILPTYTAMLETRKILTGKKIL